MVCQNAPTMNAIIVNATHVNANFFCGVHKRISVVFLFIMILVKQKYFIQCILMLIPLRL